MWRRGAWWQWWHDRCRLLRACVAVGACQSRGWRTGGGDGRLLLVAFPGMSSPEYAREPRVLPIAVGDHDVALCVGSSVLEDDARVRVVCCCTVAD